MNPALIFLLIFVAVPVIELYLMIEVGAEIGAIPTVFLVVFTAVLGGLMVRMQGFSTANQVRKAMARDEVPAVEVLAAVLILLAGLLLLLPGFVTDAIGFLLLIPPVRRLVVMWVLSKAVAIRPATKAANKTEDYRVIEGDYRRED